MKKYLGHICFLGIVPVDLFWWHISGGVESSTPD